MTSHEEILSMWRECLVGRVTRLEVAHWALERAWTLAPEQIAEEIGLQCLYRGKGWSTSGRDGIRVTDYETDHEFRELCSKWVETCAVLDRGVTGSVWISENPDLDAPPYRQSWSGRFSGYWSAGKGLTLHSPEDMDVDEAIVWGRARSDTVTLQVRGGQHFSAGRVGSKDLPEWRGGVDLSPAEEWMSGEEWRDTYVHGIRIRWKVTCASSLIPDGGDRQAEFADAIAADQTVGNLLFGSPPAGFLPSEAIASEVSVEVEADSEDEAGRIGMEAVRNAALEVVRRHGKSGALGFTMSVSARPMDE